ncbi:MAG: transposase, partial [Alphaproteobacteria bacterium]|nr:transposase [Alphaproteobacteria bacterium]
RELERFLQENTAGKWFCGFGLSTTTPSFSLFSKVRSRIGTKRLSKLFSSIRDSLQAKGYMSEVFTFVDATHLIAKATLWKERDKAETSE